MRDCAGVNASTSEELSRTYQKGGPASYDICTGLVLQKLQAQMRWEASQPSVKLVTHCAHNTQRQAVGLFGRIHFMEDFRENLGSLEER